MAARIIPGLTDNTRLFVTGYRAALERGAATVTRRGRFDGREAIWLAIKADGQQQEVIIDADSYRPIAFREVGTVESTLWRVERFDSRPRRAGDFEAHPIKTAEGGRVVSESAISLSGLSAWPALALFGPATRSGVHLSGRCGPDPHERRRQRFVARRRSALSKRQRPTARGQRGGNA